LNLRLRTSINSLEFISSIVTIWIDILLDNIHPEDCFLSQTDSSSAAGWLCKSNFADDRDEEIQLSTTRKLATLLIDSQCCVLSQWFLGEANNISDSLSRDFHISNSHLVAGLSTTFPEQVPFGLEIHQLPTEISSWVTSLLLSCPQTMQWSKEPLRSSFARGADTRTISCPSGSMKISSLKTLTEGSGTRFLRRSASQSEKVDLVLSLPNLLTLTV
jgi:hypothetical protein